MENMANLPDSEQTTPPNPQSNPPSHLSTQPTDCNIQNPYHNRTNYHSHHCLNLWLQQARRTTNPTNCSPSPTQTYQPTTLQTTLNTTSNNEHWGNTITFEQSPDVLRVISKNVNSLNTDDNFVDWKATVDALDELKTNVVCLQETNLRWQPDITLRIHQIICDSTLKTSHLNTSNTTKHNKFTNYQPSGTFITAFGPWVSCVHHSGNDASGMGWWSYIEFDGRSHQRIIIVSGYCACPRNPRLGSMTYYDQQYQIMLANGNP